jgi:hypothetical protein
MTDNRNEALYRVRYKGMMKDKLEQQDREKVLISLLISLNLLHIFNS